MSFPSHIFKAYDIRGLVKNELSEDLAYRIGRAFVTFLRDRGENLAGKKIVVGRDMRESSPLFSEAVVRGLLDEGANVVNIGLSTTPLFNFACAHYPQHAGGIMITASHNPAEYNGFKLTLSSGLPVGRNSGMDKVRDLAEKNIFKNSDQKGTEEMIEVFPDYKERVFSLVKPEKIKKFKIVIDAGNGMADVTIPKILKHLPVEPVYLYLEPDGRFPNHEANPLKTETLKDLQKKVLEVKADFGFAFDGDADRIGLVDEKGEIVDASLVGCLMGLEVLRDNPKSHLLYDLRSSSILEEIWEKAGATTEKSVVGHALIKKMMAETGAVYASELSLHLYYREMYNLESTDLSLLYVLRMLSREKKKLSELVAPLKKYFHSGEINFEVHDKSGAMKAVEKSYTSEVRERSELDGIWLGFDWGWLNLRPSNTEPVLRLNLEAGSKIKMESEVKKIKNILHS